MRRSSWFEYHRDHDNKIVFLLDTSRGDTLTITNDAENVLGHFKSSLGLAWRVVYKSTDDEWWEIVERTTWMGRGVGFEPWHGLVWDKLKS